MHKASPDVVVLLKVFVITAVSTYPFILLVSTLSSIDTSKLLPCDEHNSCILVKLIGDEYIPSTIKLGANPFMMVRNGDELVGTGPSKFLSPRCPGKSADGMSALCASSDVRKNIQNPLEKGSSRIVYICFIAGWFSFKVLHDCLLLFGVDEFITLQVGLASVAFQSLAVAAAFVWSMSAAEVFVAPIAEATCGCYYELGEIETLLAILTPATLYKMCVSKIDAICRAAVNGDFLYFVQYDIPHHLVAQSIADPSGSYLVATTYGSQLGECRPGMRTSQFRRLRLVYHTVDIVLNRLLVNVCIGLAVGPVVARLMELAVDSGHRSGTSLLLICVAMLVLAIFPALVTFTVLKKFVDFWSWRVLPIFWGWTPWVRVSILTTTVGGSIAVWLGALALIAPLPTVVLGGTVTIDANMAWRWSLAGFACFVFGLAPLADRMTYPSRMALAMKARVPLPPEEYVVVISQHPEFGLAEELELAESFLPRNPDLYGIDRREEWNHELGWTPLCCAADPYISSDSADSEVEECHNQLSPEAP